LSFFHEGHPIDPPYRLSIDTFWIRVIFFLLDFQLQVILAFFVFFGVSCPREAFSSSWSLYFLFSLPEVPPFRAPLFSPLKSFFGPSGAGFFLDASFFPHLFSFLFFLCVFYSTWPPPEQNWFFALFSVSCFFFLSNEYFPFLFSASFPQPVGTLFLQAPDRVPFPLSS